MSQWGTRPSPFSSAEVTVIRALIGSGTAYTDGQLLIGATSDGLLHAATLTQGTGVTITNGSGAITISASAGTGLTIGSSTITSGTSTRILYDNAGVLGEYTISGSGTVVAMATSPSFTTPTLGVATATSINKMAITAPATSSTLAVADGKTFTVSNSLTLAGTDSTTMTFPSTSATIARTDAANTFTGHQTIEGVTTTGATGTGKLVFDGSPTLVTAVLGSSTATTQAPADNSTKVATTAYVDNAVLGQRYKEAVKYASTGALPSIVYANGSSGVGATLTGVALAAISLDSSSPSVNDRVLIKNQVSDFQNGIYVVTATGSGIAVFVLTRAADFDQSSDIQTGDTVFVTAGSTLANTTWTYTGIDSPTMGTTSLTFAQAAGPGSYTQGAGITITGVSIAITAPVTVALGGTNATSASITAFNNITGYSAAGATGTTSTNLVFSTSPTLVTPVLGAATATSINGNTFTTGTYTLTGTAGKTLNFTNTLTFSGTDSTTMTFPASSATIAGLGISQTFTGIQTFSPAARSSGSASYLTINAPADTGISTTAESIGINHVGATRTWADGTTATQREYLFQAPTYNKTTTSATFTKAATLAVSGAPTAGSSVTITNAYAFWVQAGMAQFDGQLTTTNAIYVNNAITATSNAATVPVTSRVNSVTNSSAATLTVTLTTSGAVDGQLCLVRIYDFSAVAQTITWVNTENSTVTATATSNGSTTLPVTVGFQYNGGTSKWRCIAAA